MNHKFVTAFDWEEKINELTKYLSKIEALCDT